MRAHIHYIQTHPYTNMRAHTLAHPYKPEKKITHTQTLNIKTLKIKIFASER